MSYLDNEICTFTPLFNINYKIQKNIISCSFFKMLNKGYKDFNIYIDGLEKLNNFFKKINNFTIRLFIDKTINDDKEIMNRINKMKNIELVLFSCQKYLIKDNYHEGLFGTLVRFFPMFNFKNNDAKYVIISDIDDIVFFKLYKIIKTMIKNNQINGIYILKIGNIGKNVKYNYNLYYKNVINPYSIAQNVASFKRLDYNILINFLKDAKISDKVLSFYYEFQKKTLNNEIIEFEKKYNYDSSFKFGIDEYFLNKTLTEYLIDNKIPLAVCINWEIFSPVYYILVIEEYLTSIQKKLLNILLDFILKKFFTNYDENLSIKDKFKLIDNILYDTKNNNNKLLLNQTIYKLFLYFYKNKNYKFIYPKEFYDLLLQDEYFGVYNFSKIIYYNINYKNITLSSLKFDDNFINKLKIYYDKYVK